MFRTWFFLNRLWERVSWIPIQHWLVRFKRSSLIFLLGIYNYSDNFTHCIFVCRVCLCRWRLRGQQTSKESQLCRHRGGHRRIFWYYCRSSRSWTFVSIDFTTAFLIRKFSRKIIRALRGYAKTYCNKIYQSMSLSYKTLVASIL